MAGFNVVLGLLYFGVDLRDAGAATLEDLRSKSRLTRITGAGLIESHPHSVTITREAPNYRQEL